VRCFRFKVVIHENNVNFGDDDAKDHLGDIYIVIRATRDPVTEGWATARLRQFLLLILKCWGFDVLRDFQDEMRITPSLPDQRVSDRRVM